MKRPHLAIRWSPDSVLVPVCGVKMAHPVALALSEETRSPMDLPNLCKRCREEAVTKGFLWESAVVDAEGALHNE